MLATPSDPYHTHQQAHGRTQTGRTDYTVALREKPIARKVTRKGKRKADRAPTDTRYGKNPKTKEEAEAFKAILERHPDLPKYEDAKKQAREILAPFADFKLAMQRANAILRKE